MAKMAFLTSKDTVRENGNIVAHFIKREKFKVISNCQKVTKMAFLLRTVGLGDNFVTAEIAV